MGIELVVQMATMAMMAQAVGISTASSSNIGVNARLSNARRCSPAGASFSDRPARVFGLSVLGLGSGTMLRQKEVVVCAATEEKERASKEIETEKEKEKAIESEPDVEAVTRKFGLEAGLWKVGFFLSP